MRLDDRGTGASTGPNTEASTTADRVADMRAALAWLRAQKQVTPAALGVLGHSEGAAIAAELAAEDPKIAWTILLCAPAQRGQTVWLDRPVAGLRAHLGEDQSAVERAAAVLREVTEKSLAGKFRVSKFRVRSCIATLAASPLHPT